jgi:hypothetical protein
MSEFIFTFSQASLDENNKLIRTAEELSIKAGSIFQIYDAAGNRIDNKQYTSYDPTKNFSINWVGDTLTVDMSFFAPLSGSWSIHFDQTLTFASDNSPLFEFTQADLDASGKLIKSKELLGVIGEPIVQLYDNSNNMICDGPYWSNDPTKAFAIGWNVDSLVIDLSVFAPISGTWKVKFDSVSKDKTGTSYIPRETTESILADPNDLVICLRGGLVITLPDIPADKASVKVATQLITSAVSIIPSTGAFIGNEQTFELSESYSYAEFVYNAEINIWRIISPVRPQSSGTGYIPVEISSNYTAQASNLVICNVGGIAVILPSGQSNGTMIKVAMQRIQSPVQILSSNGDAIDHDSSMVIEDQFASVEFCYNSTSKIWKIITPHIPRPSNTSPSTGGYNPIEITVDYQASASDFVIARAKDLDVTLPSNPKNEDMIKIAAQEFGHVMVIAGGDYTIGGMNSLLVSRNSSVELVYNLVAKEWRIIAVINSEDEQATVNDSETFMVHESNIKDRDQFKDWIYRKLGYPLVSVELTEEQLDDAINDALAEFCEYAYQIRRYYAFELTLYKSDGFTMPAEVVGVDHVTSNLVGPNAVGAGKIDNYMNDLIANGAVGFPLLGRPAGSGWFNYELAMGYLDLSQQLLGGDYQSSYDVRTRKLVLDPNPIQVGQTSGWIVAYCQCLRPDDKQFGDIWVKKMALALAKITLGEVRSKFTGVNFPGGGTLSLELKADGIKERDEAREDLIQRYPVVDVFLA